VHQSPAWLEDGPRRQVRAARDEGWIVPGASVIDLGSGIANTAAWLASLGHDVTALEFSKTATERARQLHGDVPGLTLECTDVTAPIRLDHRFDVVLDLGCLHQLPEDALSRYVENIHRVTKQGTRLLYLMRIWDSDAETPESKAAFVCSLLGDDFSLVLVERSELQKDGSTDIRPGVELRFIRR
jgi:SAM-dependent methyltransferase